MNIPAMRLPSPYRPEAEVAAACLREVQSAFAWPAAAAMATRWLEAARGARATFWAVETLLREYPIASAEGNALMRLAEALSRVPDRETAIALTADQLGRAAFDSHSDNWIATLSARALALSKAMLPAGDGETAGMMGRLGGEAGVAVALRAGQLLGRQCVLGERTDDDMPR